MSEKRVRTHWEDCWRDPSHHECAVAKIEAMQRFPDQTVSIIGECPGCGRRRAFAARIRYVWENRFAACIIGSEHAVCHCLRNHPSEPFGRPAGLWKFDKTAYIPLPDLKSMKLEVVLV